MSLEKHTMLNSISVSSNKIGGILGCISGRGVAARMTVLTNAIQRNGRIARFLFISRTCLVPVRLTVFRLEGTKSLYEKGPSKTNYCTGSMWEMHPYNVT